MKIRVLFLAIMLAGILCSSEELLAQQEISASSSHFDTNNPFDLNLELSFNEFIEKFDSSQYVSAEISYYDFDSVWQNKVVLIKPRGAYRKKTCELPPLTIFFSDEDYEIELFNSLKKVKLVNSCGLTCAGNQYLLRENLTYKAYELFSDFSFRTYSLKIKFINTDDPTEQFTHNAFIIEDIKQLAKRKNAKIIKTKDLDNGYLDNEMESIMSMFEFMIGNTDWYVPNLHNLKMLLPENSAKPIPIPYDFDFSGLVNADYAFPNKSVPIDHVRERFYLGECVSKDRYLALFDLFRQKKAALYNIFQQCLFLDPLYQKDVLEYLDSFYELIEHDNSAKRYFMKKCWNTKQ